MKTQSLLRKAVLALLVALWATCFALSLSSALRHVGLSPVIVKGAASHQDFPMVTGFVSSWRAGASELRPGDQLVRLGSSELRGANRVEFSAYVARETPAGRVQVLFERGGQRQETTLVMDSYAVYWPRLPAAAVFVCTALILATRGRPVRMARRFGWSHFSLAFLLACTFAGSPPVMYASVAVHLISLSLAGPLALRSLLIFPYGVESRGWLPKVGPWLFSVAGPLDLSRVYLFPFSHEVGARGLQVVALIFFATFLIIITRMYWKSDALGRRRLKWYLLGVYFAFSLPAVFAVIALVNPDFNRPLIVGASSLVLIPIAHIISIMKYKLFDIDRIISVTATYSVLSVVFLAVLLTAVPTLSRALSSSVGAESVGVQVVLSVAFAALIVPINQHLRPLIDKVFFAERLALEQGISQLLKELTGCADAEGLTRFVGDRLHRLLRPESCVIYARGQNAFSPVFARGSAVPPAFETRSSFISSLEARSSALETEEYLKHGANSGWTALDRGALETLGAPVVLPIRRGAVLVAFACLGPKRSGDIYTSTDLVFLNTLADKASGQLLTFDQAELVRQSRAMQQELRRYIPGALAEHIESGHDLDVGEREVTVLFVDIRGYSTYAETRKAADVFKTVSRFANLVSEIVRAHSGVVVEFNGDGMMAVFGAPEKLREKERCAAEAACRIVSGMTHMELQKEEKRSQHPALSVGVGIATGDVFVGNIQSADRLLWTAIGKTTNLAARLQALTRELNASILTDTATWSQAKDIAKLWKKRENVAIRGLSEIIDIYELSHDPSNAVVSPKRVVG